MVRGGEGGIRTPGTLSGTAVFKTACFNRSHTSPREQVLKLLYDAPHVTVCVTRLVPQGELKLKGQIVPAEFALVCGLPSTRI